jgi:hypothetical protein
VKSNRGRTLCFRIHRPSLNVWRGGKPHKGFCALLGAACHWPEDRHSQVQQQAVVAVESCCHKPRVEAVRRHPGPIETSRQFSREQDVGELGFAVAAKAPVGALGVEIVERDVGSLMRLGYRGDDAGRRALLQPVEEELAEQKRRQVVDRPGQFDAVLRSCRVPYIAPALLTSTSSFG